VAGVASATVANVGGRCIQADEGPLVSGERPVLTQVRSMGPCGSGSPTRSAGVAWTLNKYTPAKGV